MNEIYGLPAIKKYLLTDNICIQKTIEFFDYCPNSQKAELSRNINKQAKALGGSFIVKENSSFYKFADKDIIEKDIKVVTEKFDPDNRIEMLLTNSRYSIFYNNIQNRQVKTKEDLVSIEEYFILHTDTIRSINESEFASKTNIAKTSVINVLDVFNTLIDRKYMEYFDVMTYVNGVKVSSDVANYNRLYFKIIQDMFFSLSAKIDEGVENVGAFKGKMCILKEMVDSFHVNTYVINRYINTLLLKIDLVKTNSDKQFTEVVTLLRSSLFAKDRTDVDNFILSPSFMSSNILKFGPSYMNLGEYLMNLNRGFEDCVRNTMMVLGLNNIRDNNEEFMNFELKNIIGKKHMMIINILSDLDGALVPKNVKYYNTAYEVNTLTDKDLLFIREKLRHDYYELVYPSYCKCNKQIYFGVCRDSLYLFGKNTVSGNIIAMLLYRPDMGDYNTKAFRNLLDETPTTTIKTFEFNQCIPVQPMFDYTKLTEGLSFDKEGNLKFRFNRNTRYMDKYDRCHQELAANWDAKNYEGVKKNLAFLFTLIIEIDREYVHVDKKKHIDEEKKKDALKARMFAINDFKTYMKKIKVVEKDFDFTKYYEDHDYDKITLTVHKDTVVGAKKLFQLIMMG